LLYDFCFYPLLFYFAKILYNRNPNAWLIVEEQMDDIRWVQRLSNCESAFKNLKVGVEIRNKKELSELEKQGLIQSFEYTFELSWDVMKDYAHFEGNPDINGSREAIKEAFRYGLIKDGEGWLEMIATRNLTAHTYNKKTAETVINKICEKYIFLFESFINKMIEIRDKNE
jgi:nucleotidyltransferase substrate binding protein (TIGR01987 family)